MDQNTALLVGGLVVALIIAVLVMGRKMKNVKIPTPFGDAQVGGSGPTITENVVDGEDHTIRALGDNSDISENQIKGKRHNIQAGGSGNEDR